MDTLIKWEENQEESSIAQLKQLAEAFFISVEDLTKESATIQPRKVLGYCEICKKYIYAGDSIAAYKKNPNQPGRGLPVHVRCLEDGAGQKRYTAGGVLGVVFIVIIVIVAIIVSL